ncbi:MAG TPA: hypothetical protein VN796_09215, partial [Acidimicrobiales bacterium]|nr:hypothetical protein [Acidimicrobiales bacterium]
FPLESSAMSEALPAAIAVILLSPPTAVGLFTSLTSFLSGVKKPPHRYVVLLAATTAVLMCPVEPFVAVEAGLADAQEVPTTETLRNASAAPRNTRRDRLSKSLIFIPPSRNTVELDKDSSNRLAPLGGQGFSLVGSYFLFVNGIMRSCRPTSA